jgi:hypothetical protein
MITIEKKSLKVGEYVDTKHVDEVIRTYKQERWVHNSKRIGKEDSLSGWYSVEELEEFIETIKDHGADGIRFYFGAYPENHAPKPEYAGRQTMVLVATKSKETEAGTKHKDVYVTKGGSTTIMAYNLINLCPPYCSGFSSQAKSDFVNVGLTIIDKGDEGMAVV